MDMHAEVITFRMAERVGLTVIIVAVALIVMVAFWKSVQKIDLKPSDATLGLGGSVVFVTPVFVLLAMILYSWISLSHPISVAPAQTAAPPPDNADAQLGSAPQFLGINPSAGRSSDLDERRDAALAQVRSLNCLAPDPDTFSTEVRADLNALKLSLLEPVWSETWGDYASFAGWVALGTGAPSALAQGIWTQGHGSC